MHENAGRTRQRLAKMLAAAFPKQLNYVFKIEPHQIYPAKGGARTCASSDTYRWTAHGSILIPGRWMPCCIDSFSTMTDCLRRGVTISEDRAFSFGVEAAGPEIRT